MIESQESEVEDPDNLDSMLEDLWNDYDKNEGVVRSDIENKPVKSVEGLVEGLIEKIKNNPLYWNKCDVIDREDVIDIIKEYCDVSKERYKSNKNKGEKL